MTTKPNQTVLPAEVIKNINNLLTRHPLVLVEGRALMTQLSRVALIDFLKCPGDASHIYCVYSAIYLRCLLMPLSVKSFEVHQNNTQGPSRCFRCSLCRVFPICSMEVLLPNYEKSAILFLLFWLFMCTRR